MVLAVIVIVVVSILAAMGFMISGNGGIEQSGLMQLHSLPTGASVKIDGNTIFPRTNLSRTLTSGTHQLELSRDGYDSWSNEIKVRPGVLLRIYYPRLFLQNRASMAVTQLSKMDGLEFYAPSAGRNYILYALKGSHEWQLVDIRGDEIKMTTLDLSGVLPGMVEQDKQEKTQKNATNNIAKHEYNFAGEIMEVKWSGNEEAVLVKVKYEDKLEWVLVQLRDLAHSLNITKTFGLEEAQIAMIDNAANQLYVLERKQLRRVNTVDGVMSRVLLNNVVSFANNGANVVYVREDDKKLRTVGVYRDNDKDGTPVTEVPEEVKDVRVAIARYYDEDYIVYLYDNKLTILYGRIPNYNSQGADLSSLKQLASEIELAETPASLVTSPDNEYLVMQKNEKLMIVDLDMADQFVYEAPTAQVRWYDASMMYAIKNGQIIVWDYDGANRRNLAESMNEADRIKVVNQPVVVSSNNVWMYYLTSDEADGVVLRRERIRD